MTKTKSRILTLTNVNFAENPKPTCTHKKNDLKSFAIESRETHETRTKKKKKIGKIINEIKEKKRDIFLPLTDSPLTFQLSLSAS
jgi:hypothetical protein